MAKLSNVEPALTPAYVNADIGGTGTTSAPSYLKLVDTTAVARYTFFDTSANLRVHTAVPTSNSDGLVLGTVGVTFSDLAESILQQATVTVTNAQLKALRATPKTLVAAPGSGKVIEFVSAIIKNNGGTNAITETADNMAIKFTDGSGVSVSQTIEATGFVDQTAATLTNARPAVDTIVAYASGANKALVLHNTGDGEYGGNAAADVTLTVIITYRVLTV